MATQSEELAFNPKYPAIADLKKRASRRIPPFVFDYLEGGCNDDINLARNKSDIQEIELMPEYLKDYDKSDIGINIFGQHYDAPFGVAPIGLQGLIWPNSAEILARASLRHNIPFILSTVSTSSVERIAELTEGKAWFQLYHPAKKELLDDLLRRVAEADYSVLVILADVPTFGFRPRDIRNGLSMPPRFSIKNMLQILSKPKWALNTLLHGKPEFATMKPYIPKNLNMKQLGKLMDQNFEGRLTIDRISRIRDTWKKTLVIKGVVNQEDAEKAYNLGVDGIIVSNHGGRQLDAGQSTIKPLQNLAAKYGDKFTVMMDGGIRSGPDIARALACGAHCTFMGRSFMYGVGALGNQGGDHTISIFKIQLKQVMEQLGCEKIADLPHHLVR